MGELGRRCIKEERGYNGEDVSQGNEGTGEEMYQRGMGNRVGDASRGMRKLGRI
jgi:hypothetical protein